MTGSKAQSRIRLFFFISGATALVYEVVWLRLLGLIFGNTTYAVSTILTAYMAGLGLGGYFLGRAALRWSKPLRVYGVLEAGIGAYAALTPLWMWLIQGIFAAVANPDLPNGPFSLAVKFLLSFLVVFVPTFFMGGTLPVLMNFLMKDDRSAGSATGLLYALNTAGAVAGTLGAGLFLLPVLGTLGALITAVLLNLGIGGLALLLSAEFESGSRMPEKNTANASGAANLSLAIPFGLFLSGFCAMLYEIGWTRILATVLSSATYAFTLMLASFLFGMACGSWNMKKRLAQQAPEGLTWGWLQITIACSSLLMLPLFPWVSVAVVRLYGLTLGYPKLLFLGMSLISVLLMFIPAFCFGALFPLSSALFIRNKSEASRSLGKLYLWNTLGNILGSVGAGFILIPWLGIHKTLLIAVILGALVAAVTVWVVQQKRLHNSLMFVLALATLTGAGISWQNGWDVRLLSSGLNIDAAMFVGEKTEDIFSRLLNHRILFYRDGLNCTVSVGQEGDNVYLKVNGKTDASTRGDMSTQLLLGHLPHLLHPDPKRSLVIGFGSGMTLAATLAHPVEHVDCVEIEPAVMEAARFFKDAHHDDYKDKRARILVNDGRNHLLLEKKKYDVIVSEPSNPWMAGVSYLFTTDFYRMAKTRLNDGGILCQWIHAYAMKPEDFWMVVASVRHEFGHVTLWRANADDYLIIAQEKPFIYDFDAVEKKFSENERVRKDMKALEISGAAGLLARFRLGEESIKRYADEAALNTDDRLSLEFSTPLSLYDAGDMLKQDLVKAADKEGLPPITSARTDLGQSGSFKVGLGKGYLGMDLVARAESYFRMAPEDPEAMAGLGRCLMVQGRRMQAVALFEKSGTAEALGFLGRLYWQEQEWDKALDAIDRSLALDDSPWENHYWRGECLEKLNRPAEAVGAYQKALDLGALKLAATTALYRAMRNAGKNELAFAGLEALRKDYPMDYPIYQELKPLYLQKGDLDPLIKYYETLVEKNPYFADYWLDLIGLYIKKGDQEGLAWAMQEAKKLQF